MKLRHKVAIGAMVTLPVLTGGVAYASVSHPTSSVSTSVDAKAGTAHIAESPEATVDSGPDLKGGPNLNSGPNVNVQSGSQSTVGPDTTGGSSS